MKKLYFLLFAFVLCSLSYGQVINEVDADTPGTDMAEFVEILWTPNTALDNLTVVFFNGNGDASYQVYDLDGFTTDADGFFILANDGIATGSDIAIGASNVIQNGADAVALYSGDFVLGDPVTSTNLLSGVVYDTGDADDAELLAAIGGVQYDERENMNSDGQSVQRNTDGTYTVKNITFRAANDSAVCDLTLGAISATCDNFTPGTDTYTVTLGFSGGGTSTYTVMADSGVVDLSMGDPTSDAMGTITVTGVNEGTDVTITVQDGALCDLSSMATSPVCEPSNALPIYEAFDYTSGGDLGSEANWNYFSGSGNPIDITTGNLSYTGLADSSGNSINIVGGGEDAEIEFTEVNTGDVYASFIMQVNDQSAITDLTDGGYFALFGGFDARFWVHPDTDPVGSTFNFAYTNGSSASTFTTTSYNVGEPIFVVMSYNVETGVLNAWINPASGDLGGSAPAVTLTDTDASPGNISRFAFRQDSNGETPDMTVDELRIGTTWADVTPTTLSNNEFDLDKVSIYPNPTDSGFVTINSTTNGTLDVQVFDLLGKQVKNETLTNNTLDVSNLNTGMYIVKITQNNASITKKLVIR